jgi:hypothetical protein
VGLEECFADGDEFFWLIYSPDSFSFLSGPASEWIDARWLLKKYVLMICPEPFADP